MTLPIAIEHERIREFCERNQIRRLAFFGSVLRDDFTPESDVDVLVEFVPGATIGYLAMARMERELSDLLARRVDLRTPSELSHYFRSRVLAEAREEYVA